MEKTAEIMNKRLDDVLHSMRFMTDLSNWTMDMAKVNKNITPRYKNKSNQTIKHFFLFHFGWMYGSYTNNPTLWVDDDNNCSPFIKTALLIQQKIEPGLTPSDVKQLAENMENFIGNEPYNLDTFCMPLRP